jgi:hypothetical protein
MMLSGGPAIAATSSARAGAPYTCSGGDIPSGAYAGILVTGKCAVPLHATVTVAGNLTVASGAMLDADSAPSTLTVGRNVIGEPGSMIGLGCTAAHGGCGSGPDGVGPYAGESSSIVIKGGVALDHVYNAALDGLEVMGTVSSTGGGAGLALDQFIPFSVKDDVIHGNLSVSGLTTTWFGVIRTTVGGNVVLTNIVGADPDSNEVVHSTIGKNLVCTGLNPAPQFGDAVIGAPAGYAYSTVGGRVNGQCGFVLAP